MVADLPFGSYEVSSAQALTSAIRLVKEGRANAVKLEGNMVDQVKALVAAGLPTDSFKG